MKTLYTLLFSLCLALVGLNAQSIEVPPNLDGTDAMPFTDLSDFIEADTASDGSQNNVEYLVQRGSLYYFTFDAKWSFDVEIRATGDEALGRPLILRRNKTGGTNLARLYSGTGSFTLDGLFVIMGEEGANAASYETNPIRCMGVDKRFILNDCVLEKNRQAIIRSEGDGGKIYVTNNWIRNVGDYQQLQGNGRVVDVRTSFSDSVLIQGNVIHNILDRVFIGFRMQGLNYFEYSGNTLFNHVGRHGMIQLKNTKESVITDNLFMNPSIMGTAPSIANEQINFRDSLNFLFTLDTLIGGGSVPMSNNNVFWKYSFQPCWKTWYDST